MLLLPHYTPGQMFRVVSQDDVCGFADHWESLYGFPRASSEHGSAFIPWEDSIPCVSWEGSLLSHMLAGGQPQWAPPDKVKLWGSSLLPPQEFPARELTLGAGSISNPSGLRKASLLEMLQMLIVTPFLLSSRLKAHILNQKGKSRG